MVIDALPAAVESVQAIAAVRVPMAQNPFEGLSPDFLSLGGRFTEWWQQLFTALWGILIIIAGVFLAIGLTTMANAGDDDPRAHKKGKAKTTWAGISVVGLAGFGIIMNALLGLA